MRHFFIDLENVRSAGLDGVTSLTADDRVYVFYSDNANTLTIPTLESIGNSEARVQYLKITRTGSNAMDFQIVSLYSALIEREKQGSFFIISHDNGFKSAISFCEHYFTEYDLVLASFSSIRAALENRNASGQNAKTVKNEKESTQKQNNGKKNSSRNQKPSETKKENAAKKDEQAEKTADKADTTVKEEESEKPAKSRRRRRGRGGRDTENAENTAANSSETEAPVLEAVQEQVSAENEAEADNEKPEKKNRRNRRRGRNKNKSENAEVEQKENQPAEEKQQKTEPESGSKQYVYDILSDYATKNLLDVYVNLIDEGVRRSKNKDALKSFFVEKCEAQEAEALYSLVKIEFDALRKAKK